jgi:hypothetical protein
MKVSMTSIVAYKTVGSHDETARVTSREFKFRGKTVTMTLTAPYVRNDGNKFDFGAAWVLDGVYDPKTMSEPQQVRGFYANAEFEITGLGFPTIKLATGIERDTSGKSFIVIKSFTATGNADQSELVLPLERVRVYALQLSGVFGMVYPANYRKLLTADGKNFTQYDENGDAEIEGYGYRMTRSAALDLMGKNRDGLEPVETDATLQRVAELHKSLPHHGKVKIIAQELNTSESNAKRLIEKCRTPEFRLLPPPRKRAKTKTKTTQKKRGNK